MFQTILRPLFTMSVILTLTSCAVMPQRYPLNQSGKQSIHSTHVILNTNQKEIVAKRETSRGAIAVHPYDNPSPVIASPNLLVSIVGALVVDGIREGVSHYKDQKARDALTPARNALKDFNYAQYFNAQLNQHMATKPWLKVKQQELKYNLENNEAKLVMNSKEDATLFVGMTYALTEDFKQLEVAAYVKLVRKPVGTAALPQKLYSNNFYFVEQLPQVSLEINKNKRTWLGQNASLLKSSLRNAAAILSETIAADLSNPSKSLVKTEGKIQLIDRNNFLTKATLLQKNKGYYVTALDNDEICIVNKEKIILAALPHKNDKQQQRKTPSAEIVTIKKQLKV